MATYKVQDTKDAKDFKRLQKIAKDCKRLQKIAKDCKMSFNGS